MLDSGIERDNLHYNVSEDDGYNVPIVCVLSPREPGKTTSIMLDKIYSSFRKEGLPAVVLVNQPIDINEALLASFEEQINEFKGYEIHTKYPKSAQDTVTVIKEKDTGKPFIYVVPLSTPKTRLKRLVLGKVSCMWYDECNVDVSIGERWPDNIANKWNELYTTLARKSYPKQLKFYMTGNFYTRYNPILVYLGVDCNKLEIGKKILTKKKKQVGDITLDYSTLVDCYQLTPELRDYILAHNPGYSFDDTYERYFRGEAIADLGVPIEENQPENFSLRKVFKVGTRYLYIYKRHDTDGFRSYWLKATGDAPGKRHDIWIVNLNDLQSNSMLAKSFKGTFDSLRFAIGSGRITFQSPEAFYMMQNIYSVL